MKKLAIVYITSLLCLLSLPAAADKFDGTVPMLCASIEANACAVGGECLGGLPEEINAPQFARIDVNKKLINVKRSAGEKQTTKIQSVKRMDGKLILQGVENGRGWSITISETTGKMTAAAASDEVAFMLFGACTNL